MSPKHAPRRQETARLGETRCFGERCQKRFWSSKITPKLPLGNSGTPLDQTWENLKFPSLPKLRHKNRPFASFRIFPDIWRDSEAYLDHSSISGVFTWAAGGPNSMESREMCSKLVLSEAFLYMGSGRLITPTPDF